MTIYVDGRTGSRELADRLTARGAPVEITTLGFGDFSFEGSGPGGRPVPIGIERKSIGDMLRCMVDARFVGHQIPGLLSSYELNWLVVEGSWRPSKEGILEVPWRGQGRFSGLVRGVQAPRSVVKGKKGASSWMSPDMGAHTIMYRELDRYLITMTMRAGMRVWRTYNEDETAQFIFDLYKWWQKDWDKHHAHCAFDNSDMVGGQPDDFLRKKHSLVMRWAKELTGIRWKRSQLAAKMFRSARALAFSTAEDWMKIKGVNRRMAEQIEEEMDREE